MPTHSETHPPGAVGCGSGSLKESSHVQILKSTAWIGGSQVLNIAIGIVRTKIIATLLGPEGFGLAGLYGSIASLTQSIAGLGINSSGVRQIAEAVGSGDSSRVALTASVLRRISLALGILGALVLAGFSTSISKMTFGSDQHATSVALVGLAVFFSLVSAGQGAQIQGMRRISDLARMGVLGALLGSVGAIIIVYMFRQNGVAPSLVLSAAIALLTSWWFSRQIEVERPSLTLAQVWEETSKLIHLGFAFMTSNMLTMASAYAVRILVMQQAGLKGAGFYQAAWTLGGMYVGMILQSMGADFYPRLTAVAHDHLECNRLVNEQAEVSLLLAGPGVLATLAFAPLVITLFYAERFGGAIELLRWISLGLAMRVISWPLGYIIMAKGKQNLIIFCELAWTVVHLGSALFLVDRFGLDGAGMAFFGSYVFHIALVALITNRVTGFLWSSSNRRAIGWYLGLITVVFLASKTIAPIAADLVGLFAIVVASFRSVRSIKALGGVSAGIIPQRLSRAVRALSWS